MTSVNPSPSSTAARAAELIADNQQATRALFASSTPTPSLSQPSPPLQPPPPPEELQAHRIRHAVAASHGPFATRKRARPNPSLPPSVSGERRLVAPGAGPIPATPSIHQVQHAAAAAATATTLPEGAPTQALSTSLTAAMPPALRVQRERAARIAAERPAAHAPWRVYRIMAGHLGWVRSIAFDPLNEWFATGSADRTIKIWDLASGRLRLTLTGHIAAVRALVASPRHPYLFSASEDKTVKCWDLEQNRVVRHYHGHLSGVYAAALHPSLDVLLSAGRDSAVRVWDIRSRAQAMLLAGHRDTVNALLARPVHPQVVSASADATVRLWDLAAARCHTTLTHHKRAVRALAEHPHQTRQSFVSAAADNIKSWGLPDGVFARNFEDAHDGAIVNALAANDDGVLVSGGDNGQVCFWDYETASRFDEVRQTPQPGSLDCEAGVFALAFDGSGSRLISAEADKTVRMWKENVSAAGKETNN